MLDRVRAMLRSRRALVCVVVLIGAAVATAHSSAGDDHMGEAVSMCLAVMALGAAAVAALPALGRWLPRPPRPTDDFPPARPVAAAAVPGWHARGDPAAFLQVFRH